MERIIGFMRSHYAAIGRVLAPADAMVIAVAVV